MRIVSQLSEKAEEHIVACASRTLSDTERKYSIVEEGALAVCEFVKGLGDGSEVGSSLSWLTSHQDYDGGVELIELINQDIFAIMRPFILPSDDDQRELTDLVGPFIDAEIGFRFAITLHLNSLKYSVRTRLPVK
ncbi:hypothetical protein LAZ67_13001405 [Cordylochernes scorpioides]|uniref:Reverse transcriptase RNase H-like domain-containing protein n=1 Tax=Cordylochernes scorpioides TaxID=51811 RepID=A0ABY6L484_9ARAC|nr:hypothetical protein LAZ67_13001405 [Cordylochernes scorpioides]